MALSVDHSDVVVAFRREAEAWENDGVPMPVDRVRMMAITYESLWKHHVETQKHLDAAYAALNHKE